MTTGAVDQESGGLNVRFRLVWAAAGLTHPRHAQQQGDGAEQQGGGQAELQEPQIQLVYLWVPLETQDSLISVKMLLDIKGART